MQAIQSRCGTIGNDVAFYGGNQLIESLIDGESFDRIRSGDCTAAFYSREKIE